MSIDDLLPKAAMHLLPASAQKLIAALGAPAAQVVLSKLAGRKLYIPKRAGSNAAARLSEHIGPDVARRMIEAFGGQRLEVPTLQALEKYRRDKEITALLHLRNDELTDRFGLSTRTVQRKRKELS